MYMNVLRDIVNNLSKISQQVVRIISANYAVHTIVYFAVHLPLLFNKAAKSTNSPSVYSNFLDAALQQT